MQLVGAAAETRDASNQTLKQINHRQYVSRRRSMPAITFLSSGQERLRHFHLDGGSLRSGG
jgi:hypothetical protein